MIFMRLVGLVASGGRAVALSIAQSRTAGFRHGARDRRSVAGALRIRPCESICCAALPTGRIGGRRRALTAAPSGVITSLRIALTGLAASSQRGEVRSRHGVDAQAAGRRDFAARSGDPHDGSSSCLIAPRGCSGREGRHLLCRKRAGGIKRCPYRCSARLSTSA